MNKLYINRKSVDLCTRINSLYATENSDCKFYKVLEIDHHGLLENKLDNDSFNYLDSSFQDDSGEWVEDDDEW